MTFDIEKYIGINQLVEDVDIINNPEAYMVKSKGEVYTPYEKHLGREFVRIKKEKSEKIRMG